MTKPKGYASTQFGFGHKKSAKLSGEQVYEIRRRYTEERHTQGRLARDFGVSVGHIGRIVRGENWIDVAQVEDPQVIRDAAADSLARLLQMQKAPLPSEEKEALERGAQLAERMGQEVLRNQELNKELDDLAQAPDLPLTKPNPYY